MGARTAAPVRYRPLGQGWRSGGAGCPARPNRFQALVIAMRLVPLARAV